MIQTGLLQAIIENPEDDAPRLAYAKWLEEHGNARGEFIRAQCELAKRLQADITQMEKDYQQRKALKTLAEQLLNALSAAWNQPMQESGCEQWEYRRGFVDTVAICGERFLQSAAILFGKEPIRRVCLTEAVPDIVALASVEYLARLCELSLQGCGIGNAGARALAASPYLRNLTTLDLSYNNIGDSGAQALASSPNLSALAAFFLSRPTMILDPNRADIIQDAGACALASSPHLARLNHLDLSGNLIGTAGEEALRSRFQSPDEALADALGANKLLRLTGAALTVFQGNRRQ